MHIILIFNLVLFTKYHAGIQESDGQDM